jgi:hypothetical protein
MKLLILTSLMLASLNASSDDSKLEKACNQLKQNQLSESVRDQAQAVLDTAHGYEIQIEEYCELGQ